MTVLRPLLLVCTATLALGACGEGGEDAPPTPPAQVREVVRQFGIASAQKDYARICDDLIAQELSDKVEQLGLRCELAFRQGLENVRGARLRIDGVRIQGGRRAFVRVHTTATGQAPSDDTLGLVLVGSQWRIDALSGAGDPQASPPPAPRSKVPPGAIPTP